MNRFNLAIFADFTDIKVIIGLLIALFAVILLFSAKKIAAAVMDKKYPEMSEESEEYKNKLLNITLIFKGIAAGFAVIACVLSQL